MPLALQTMTTSRILSKPRSRQSFLSVLALICVTAMLHLLPAHPRFHYFPRLSVRRASFLVSLHFERCALTRSISRKWSLLMNCVHLFPRSKLHKSASFAVGPIHSSPNPIDDHCRVGCKSPRQLSPLEGALYLQDQHPKCHASQTLAQHLLPSSWFGLHKLPTHVLSTFLKLFKKEPSMVRWSQNLRLACTLLLRFSHSNLRFDK